MTPSDGDTPTCPADAQPDAKPLPGNTGSSSAPPSEPSLMQAMAALITTLQRQTEAINMLANSNALLAEAMMTMADEGEPGTPTHYMDGTKV